MIMECEKIYADIELLKECWFSKEDILAWKDL